MARLATYSLRSLWARRVNTVAAAGAMALLVFVLSASRMLSAGMKETIQSAGTPDQAMVRQADSWAESGSRMDRAQMAQVYAAPGTQRDERGQPRVTREVVAHQLMARTGNREHISSILIRGVSDNVFDLRREARIVDGRPLRPATDEAVVGKKLIDRFEGLSLGDEFDLGPTGKVTVVGVFESGGSMFESEVWVDIETARASLGMNDVVSSVTAQLLSPASLDTFAAPLVEDEKANLAVERQSAYYERVSGGVSELVLALSIMETLIFSLGAALGAMLTMYTSVAQRQREIGVLRALGFSGWSVLWAFLVEAMALSVAGAAVGIGLALLTQLLDFRVMNFATGQEVAFRFVPNLEILSVSVLVAALIGIVGGFLPALKAARTSPLAAIRA